MNPRRNVALAAGLFVLVALLCTGAIADDSNQAMKLTFGQPTAIPGQVLPAGTYWFQRTQHNEENVMQIFGSDHKTLITTVPTGTGQILKPSGRVIISLSDQSPDRPNAIVSVTYPGGNLYDLIYSDQERKQFSDHPKITMKVNEKGDMEIVKSDGVRPSK